MNPLNRYPRKRPKAIDLFSGAGGMSLGFEQAGFDVLLSVELDGYHVAAHTRNFPATKSVCMSVTDVTKPKITSLIGDICDIDLVFGGPPCQGFSQMGHRDAGDPRNLLVEQFARVIQEVKPRAFVMENVPGMLAGRTRCVLDTFVSQMERSGYQITTPLQTLTASDFGVPQSRTRLFILGLHSSVDGHFDYPDGPCHNQPQRPTVIQAISDLPSIEKHDELFKTDLIPYDKKPRSRYAKIARGLEVDLSDRSIPREWDSSTCSCSTRTNHAPKSVALYAATEPGTVSPGHKLPRLDPNGVCPTLRAGSDSSRGSYTSPRPIHPILPRCITPREAARLHGYPDWFRFYPTKWHALKQIGNSVCPPVARAVGESLMQTLKIKCDSPSTTTIKLGDEFPLPDNRPRQKARIPQMREFPPVINRLFERCYDLKTRRINDGRFTFKNVMQSVKDTKANLSWVRPDTFLAEISRSRNVSNILKRPIECGYSIKRLDDGDWIGEFVPLNTPSTIEKKSGTGVRKADMDGMVEAHLSLSLLDGMPSTLESVINTPSIREEIWSKSVQHIDVFTGMLEFATPSQVMLRVRMKSSNRRAVAIIAATRSSPSITRLAQAAISESAHEAVLVAKLTTEHLLLARYTVQGDAAVMKSRRVFCFSGDREPATV